MEAGMRSLRALAFGSPEASLAGMNHQRLLPLLVLPLAACSATGPGDATFRAQRPFLSSETHTVPDQVIAVEAGAAVAARSQEEYPLAVRYGLGPRSEFYVQTAPYEKVEVDGPDGEGWGDSYVGMRHRLRDADMYSPAYGFQVATKLPTGDEGEGLSSGEIDWFGALMAQQTYYGFETTGFYQLGVLGQQDGPDTHFEHTWAAQTRYATGSPVTPFAEAAFVWEPDADREEVLFMGGASFQLDHLTAIDLAIRVGLGDAEDFQVLFGISRALGQLFFPEQESGGASSLRD
jgi:hypothetical protein